MKNMINVNNRELNYIRICPVSGVYIFKKLDNELVKNH